MANLLFTAKNVVVGAATVFVKGVVTATSSAAGNTTTATTLNPITDATKFTKGDIITIGANTEKVAITAIDTTTGTLTHEAVTTAAVTALVTQLWRNLGATDGDIEVAGETQMTDQFVDQTIYSVASVATRGSFQMNLPLADISMRNLATAMGQPEGDITTASGVDTLKFNNPSTVQEREYLVTGYGPSGAARTWRIFRGVAQAAVSAKHSKTNKQITNLKVMALFDDASSAISQLKQHATNFQY